ncbi:DUF222 domain-containing protein [Agromyces ramosus]|uniref:DUF222 domain-containing protein n=1 Tax=Agromyces ramosus TaxID=33879 RepID=A0ABU0R872_9MICO|nr:DUF222 domain-containing protein [Agromyces ramosus]MDQ0893947.1 hypothetical protein [Agromyces ramosus]
MEQPLHQLERDFAALRDGWAGALPAFGAIAGSTQAEFEQMSDAGLVEVTDRLARIHREIEAILTRAAGEIARRSGPEFGDAGLAKTHGFHNAARLIAASLGGSRADAARLVAVGAATAERLTFGAERLPSRHPHVAAALHDAVISVDAAAAITGMLNRVALRADPVIADVVEAALVELAANAPLELLLRGVREAEARLDHDGVEPRDELLSRARSLTMREDGNGMLHLHARLDPETAAPVKAAIDALVSDVLRREPTACDTSPVIDDPRSIPQMQADALAALALHALGCTQTLTPLVKTTVVVRMSLDSLTGALGHATIDGLDQPVSAATARRMAADAELIPAVFGGDSLPLDLGRTARLFTRAQRLALAERDGGCASCGHNITYAHAHHIRWWQRDTGPTDLSNGVNS